MQYSLEEQKLIFLVRFSVPSLLWLVIKLPFKLCKMFIKRQFTIP